MRILMIGDIVGRPGRECASALVPALRDELGLDFVIANAENAAGGFGITAQIAQALFESGVDALTSGDHVWSGKGVESLLVKERRVLRPANYPDNTPGSGVGVFAAADGTRVGVINLLGVTFMPPMDSPFAVAERCVNAMLPQTRVIVVDMHAEATAEKKALACHLDGQVSAVVGTHTHVQTADERILPGGTAFLTDLGMTGPEDSILGMKVEVALRRFLTRRPARYAVAEGPTSLSGAVIEVDNETGRARTITRIQRRLDTTVFQ
jgi:hypothetical protein